MLALATWLAVRRETDLGDGKRADYKRHAFEGNLWIEARKRESRRTFSRGAVVRHLADNFGNGLSSFFPAWQTGLEFEGNTHCRPNLSDAAQRCLDRLGTDVEDLFYHVVAVVHDPSYRKANEGALRIEWPRIPVPGWSSEDDGAADALVRSARRGREVAAALVGEDSIRGFNSQPLRPGFATIAAPSTTDGALMQGEDYDVDAGWGHIRSSDAVMPGHGRVAERGYTGEEAGALGEMLPLLGETTFDVYLNRTTFLRNIPANVWQYERGGYQVLKTWLSYRERAILGRPLRAEEVEDLVQAARRIAWLNIVTGSAQQFGYLEADAGLP